MFFCRHDAHRSELPTLANGFHIVEPQFEFLPHF